LDREPDTAGLNDWVSQLNSGTKTGADVAFGFVFSQEFINRATSNQDYLNVLARRGGIPAFKIRRNWLVSKDALRSYVAAKKRK
jgi:hypothetical protein